MKKKKLDVENIMVNNSKTRVREKRPFQTCGIILVFCLIFGLLIFCFVNDEIFSVNQMSFLGIFGASVMEMSRNVQSGNTQNLKSTVIQRSFPKWSVAERRKTAAASDQAAVCACAHSRYFTGGSPSGLRV